MAIILTLVPVSLFRGRRRSKFAILGIAEVRVGVLTEIGFSVSVSE